MLKYTGYLSMDEKYTTLLDLSKSVIELIEKIYLKNIKNGGFSTQITDKQIIKELQETCSIEEKNDILIKHKKDVVYPFYIKKSFIRLLGDFCLYMHESLHNLFEFKPQIAYTLARKPLIDDIFYLQYLYIDAEKTIDLILSDDPKEKDIGTKKNIMLDKENSDRIVKDLGYKNNIFYNLRYKESECGILYNCNKAMHITISRSDFKNTESGELNFIFMEDKVIEDYTKLYLHTVPILLFYAALIVMKISERINGKDNSLEKKFEKLQDVFTDLMANKDNWEEDK